MNMNEGGPIQIKLLCGADLLESFATPGLWKPQDVRFELLFSRYMQMYHFIIYSHIEYRVGNFRFPDLC